METTTIVLEERDLGRPIEHELPNQTLYVDKSMVGEDEERRKHHNILAVARKSRCVRSFVSRLANNGFFLVDHSDGISRFERLTHHERFQEFFYDPEVKVHGGMFYTLEHPRQLLERNRLLVVFSSIADFPLNARISRRMFFKNFPTISKYIPQNTYVLRIADIGSVIGSFYLNSVFDPSFETKTQELILHLLEQLRIDVEDTVFYGGSKGGTGALFHGIMGGYKTVSVDPIVSDARYLRKLDDLHFVEGNFTRYKEERFFELLNTSRELRGVNIVTSPHSEEYPNIRDVVIANDHHRQIHAFSFSNPLIKTHPDVGVQTINFVTSMINNLYYGISASGSRDYAC